MTAMVANATYTTSSTIIFVCGKGLQRNIKNAMEKAEAVVVEVKKALDATDLDEKIIAEVKKTGFLQRFLRIPCLSRTTSAVNETIPSLQRSLSIRIPGQAPKKGTPLTAEPSDPKLNKIGV